MAATFLNAAAPELILPRGEQYWTSLEMYDSTTGRPTYSTGSAAALFFGRSHRWLKKHVYDENVEILEGLPIQRDGRSPSGSRKLKLFHIEVIANGLADRRIIDGRMFLCTIEMLRIQARMWGYGQHIDTLSRRALSERAV